MKVEGDQKTDKQDRRQKLFDTTRIEYTVENLIRYPYFHCEFHCERIYEAVKSNECRPMKRQVLRTFMSTFDPLGLILPYLVEGKLLMQNVWRSSLYDEIGTMKSCCGKVG